MNSDDLPALMLHSNNIDQRLFDDVALNTKVNTVEDDDYCADIFVFITVAVTMMSFYFEE